MKLKLIMALTVSALLLTVWACKDSFLESSPQGQIVDSNYWKSEAEFQSGINAAYFAMQWDASGDSWQALAGMPTGDVRPNEDADYFNLEKLQFLPTNRYLNAEWTTLYLAVNRANLVLSKLETVSGLSPEVKNRLTGEAKFIRGFGYYMLARAWGDVPLILTEQNASSPTDVLRTPVAQVFDQVSKDLTDAASLLPAKWDDANVGRATKGSALGYLAETALYQKKWSEAAKAAESLFAIGSYGLVKDYRKVFALENENNEESVFEVQYRDSQLGWGASRNGHYFPTKQAPRGIGEKYVPMGGWGVQYPSKQVVAAFEKGDLRRKAIILAPGEDYYGFTMADSLTPSGHAFTKYWVGPYKNDHSPLNLPQLRFSEVLLSYAESLTELGRIQDAYTQLNKVRARAGLAAITPTTKEKAMDDIFQERRVETVAEFNYWYHLTRTGRAAAFVRKEYNRDLPAHQNLFPLPQSELDANKALKQNPGY
jgi:hypothetical protein